MSNTIGTLFRVTTFGESHGVGVGAVIDGCPSRLALSEQDIQVQLDRRRPGTSALVSPRAEKDKVKILSGVQGGLTLGTPIGLLVENADTRSGDYVDLAQVPRPSHADMTYMTKYGITARSGGGRASARETVGRVAAGAVAEKMLTHRNGIKIVAWVSAVGSIEAPDMTEDGISRKDVDANIIRCPDPKSAKKMQDLVKKVLAEKDSIGGIITCVCSNVPAGWGEPVFGKMTAELGRAMMSIPAIRGIEIGSGFNGARMRGSEHNDLFVMKKGSIRTSTNRSGGIQGGISNGEDIVFRLAFKPPATIGSRQKSVDYKGRKVVLEDIKGRHDPCVLPRAVPIVEAMAAIVLADFSLIAGAYAGK